MPLRRNVVVFSGVFSLFKLISLIHHSLVDEEPIILNTTEVPAQILPEQVPVDTCPREPPIWSSTRWAAPTRWMFPMTMASSNTSVYWEDLFVSASPQQDNTRELEKETGLKSTTREEQIIPEKIPADISSCTNNSACCEDLLVCVLMKNDTSILSSLEDAPTPLMTPVTEIAGTEPKPISLDDVDVHECLEFHSPEYEEEEEMVEVSWESIVSVIFIILDLYWIVSSLKKWIKRLEKISTNTKYNCKKRKRWRKLP